jgi:hypothetical protein
MSNKKIIIIGAIFGIIVFAVGALDALLGSGSDQTN